MTETDGIKHSRDFLWVRPTPLARRLFWHLLAIGSSKAYGFYRMDPFAKGGVSLHWIEQGQAEMHWGSKTIQLRHGPFCWLYSTQKPRTFQPIGGVPLRSVSIRFSGPSIEPWLEELRINEEPEFGNVSIAHLRKAKRELTQLARARQADWEEKVHHKLGDLMLYLLSLRKPVSRIISDLPEPIVRVLNAIEADPDRAWRPVELAPLAGVSYPHLRDVFRQSMHESIHEFLHQERVDRARVLLAGKLSVKEVAEKLHFGNEYYFSRFFKRRTGHSPTDFRKHAELL